MFIETAFRRADWINEKRAVAYPILFLLVGALTVFAWVGNLPVFPNHAGVVFSKDFGNVYAAGMAVKKGAPAEAYDLEKHKERERRIPREGGSPIKEGAAPWLYPPMFLAVVDTVASLPYFEALAAYLGLGFLAYLAAMAALVPNKKACWAIGAFPGVFYNSLAGQNGFLTTTLLAAGLHFLESAPVMAGMFFGLLSFKPQFFVLIPVALCVGRYWKALGVTLLTASACVAESFLAYGAEAWAGFVKSLSLGRSLILETSSDEWLGKMHTVFSMARIFGASPQAAQIVQLAAGICAILFLIMIWRRRSSLSVRGAALVSVLFLASPYSFGYDQILLAIPIALLAREGMAKGFLPFEKVFLFFLWLLPLLVVDYYERFRLPLTPPMLVGVFYFCWRHTQINRS